MTVSGTQYEDGLAVDYGGFAYANRGDGGAENKDRNYEK